MVTPNRGTAYRVVRQALDERVADNVDELRATEVARLDTLQAAVWPAAMAAVDDAEARDLRERGDGQYRLGWVPGSSRMQMQVPDGPSFVHHLCAWCDDCVGNCGLPARPLRRAFVIRAPPP